MMISCGPTKDSPFLYYDCPELDSLAHQYGEKTCYPKNHIILTSEAIVDRVYYIERGRVRYISVSEQGEEHILGILEDGSFFGLIPILLPDPTCGILVVAETAAVIYSIGKDCFIKLLKMYPEFNISIVKALAHFGNELIIQVENLLFYNNKERLLRLLYASIDKESSPEQGWFRLKIQYTQEDIGKIIGASRITVTRLISDLCKENTVRVVNHKIEVRRLA